MILQTIGQQKTLQELKDYFDYARRSEVRQRWLSQYKENLRYYYGDQWSPELKREFDDVGALPFVVNRIEPIVTTYVSLQISARRRIAYKAITNLREHARLAEEINNLVYSIHAQNDFQNKSTLKYTDALIGGLGWTEFTYDKDSSQPFLYVRVPPEEVFPDPDDDTERMDNSNFVCRSYFVSKLKLKERYPKYIQYFEDLLGPAGANNAPAIDSSPGWSSSDINDGYSYLGSSDDQHIGWTRGKSIRIVEVYYKKTAKYYEATVAFKPDEQVEGENDEIPFEQTFYTFDRELAEEKKVEGSEIIEKQGTQIWKGVFCEDYLLESGPLPHQTPNQKHFPLLPLCLKRNYLGVPYGVVDGLIPLSTSLNYVWTKYIHGLGSKFLIIEDMPGFDMAKTGELFIDQMSKKRGMIAVKNANHAQFINSENMMPALAQALQRIDVEFEQRTQLFDELKGDQTNAISGVAIQQRAINAARTQNPLHATYEHMLFSEGQLILDTIKGINDFKYTFNYYKNNKVNYSSLDNQISLVNFEIFPDIAPVFSTSNEEKAAKFTNLMSGPNPALILSDKTFLEMSGFTETEAASLHEAYMKITQAQQPQQTQEEQLQQTA